MAGKGKIGKPASRSAKKKTGKGSASRGVPPSGNITNGAIRRLARRGGVKRIAAATSGHVRDYVDDFLNKIVRDTLTFTEHRKGKSIQPMDVVYALKKNGRVLYGYGA